MAAQPSELLDFSKTTSYLLVTANNILKRYGIYLTQDEIKDQLNNPRSFYRQLLRIPAANVYNNILIEQFQSFMDFNRDELAGVLIYHYNREIEGKTTGLPDLVNEASNEYAALSAELSNLVEAHQDQQRRIDKIAVKHLSEWRSLQIENADMITESLVKAGLKLSTDFSRRLFDKLEKGAESLTLSPDLQSAIKITKPNTLVKACIATLLEEIKA